jgi:acyl-CoA synthetase (NDP forming)
MTNPEEDANLIVELSKKYPKKPIVCSFLGGRFSKRGKRTLALNNIPEFNDLRKAAKAMWALIERGKSRQ